MPLSVGDKLGHYEVLSLLGKGGMGEVYRARDTKLKREVAIKVLPEAFARDPERMARFQREAEVLASLNHPNIAHIYGVEERALVMELVEGNPPKGPLPFDEAWKIASQIAAALEYAHERGIVHRDLKPANILITSEGVVKLLDFGLAKAFSNQREPSASPENSPTLTLGATEIGVILGTAAYMAPEQARGKPVDKRADIWSFGVVLNELLTGERLFSGEDAAETLAAVIHHTPDLTRVPRQARRLIEECLQKDPRQRLRDIGDAKRLVGENAAAVASTPVSRSGKLPWIAAAGVMTAVAAIALWAPWRSAQSPARPLVRLDVDLGADVSLGSPQGSDVALSPDGTRLVYVSQSRLFTRRLDQPQATMLPGTDGAAAPFFSPDGKWVAFFTGSKLKKISVEGGAAITLCETGTARGGSWGEDGNIVLSPTAGALMQVPDGGGKAAPLTTLDREKGEVTHRFPQVLPGGQAVLFTSHRSTQGFDDANISVLSLKDHSHKILIEGGTYGRYLPSGHLVYVNRGTLLAVQFDPQRLEVRGSATPVLADVASDAVGSAQFDFARDGTLVYRSGAAGGTQVTVQWLSEDGKTSRLLAKPGPYSRPSLSPDGKRLALMVGADIWIYDLARQSLERRTFGNGSTYPMWSADSRFLLFQTLDGIGWTRADGASTPQILIKTREQLFPWSFTPDGKRLAYMEVAPDSSYDIWTVPVEFEGAAPRAGKPDAFRVTPSDERHPAFSPDGKWLAYSSTESGVFQVYVRAFPDKGSQYQISTDGGVYPTWSRTNHELFFRTEDDQIMVASYTIKGDAFQPDKPRVWTDKRIASGGVFRNFDVAPDGKRIAALMPLEGEEGKKSQSHVIFLLNFFDELRRKVPSGK